MSKVLTRKKFYRGSNMHGSVSISRFQDKLCKWRWQWHSVFIICRHQSCWREAIFVEQDIHGTVFGVGKLASIALAMTWHENWIIVQRQHIWLKNDFWWRRKHEQKWGDCRPLEWRRASTPLKWSSLNITVKGGAEDIVGRDRLSFFEKIKFYSRRCKKKMENMYHFE